MRSCTDRFVSAAGAGLGVIFLLALSGCALFPTVTPGFYRTGEPILAAHVMVIPTPTAMPRLTDARYAGGLGDQVVLALKEELQQRGFRAQSATTMFGDPIPVSLDAACAEAAAAHRDAVIVVRMEGAFYQTNHFGVPQGEPVEVNFTLSVYEPKSAALLADYHLQLNPGIAGTPQAVARNAVDTLWDPSGHLRDLRKREFRKVPR